MMSLKRERAAELVRGGLSYGQAAKKMNMTRSAVASACRDAGVRTGPRQRIGVTRLVATLYARGLPYAEIAKKAGLKTPQSVCVYLARAGVARNRRSRA